MTFKAIGQSVGMQRHGKPEGGGPQLGATIATTPRQGSSVPDVQRSDQIAVWLAKQRPADMDKAAVSRALSRGVGLQVKYEWRFPSGPNGEYMNSYQVAVGCNISQHGDREAALQDLRNFLTPAPIRAIEAWLAELSVIVARRKDDEFADELRVSVYSSRLSRFPADVVRTVVIEQSYRFWPTWEELEKRCKALTGPRLQMIAALERGPEPIEPQRRAPTDDERARIAALVEEMFPDQTPKDRSDAVEIALRGNCMTVHPGEGAAQ